MSTIMLARTVVLTTLISLAAPADAQEKTVTGKGVEAHDVARVLTRDADGPGFKDRHLAISEGLKIDAFDPRLGELERVSVNLELTLEQGFWGHVSDGLPLSEDQELVANAGQLALRLDLVGPDGSVLESELIQSTAAGCSGHGVCSFAHHEKLPVKLSFDARRSAFENAQRDKLILRVTSTGGMLTQLCARDAAWSNCRIDEARLGVTLPEKGLSVTYHYRPHVEPIGQPRFSVGSVLSYEMISWLVASALLVTMLAVAMTRALRRA